MTDKKWDRILKKANRKNNHKKKSKVRQQVVEQIYEESLLDIIERDHCKVRI